MTMLEKDRGASYRAFISYSHRDQVFASRLHRWLEAYRLPARLNSGRRLSPIFRDREELPAARDLSAQVRAALAGSEVLIVVCSPDAAASPWVGREIETFRALNPDRPVLAALIRGEPVECFPSALSRDGLEPLAADFRRSGDGDRLAFLKLVAGIAGVGLDQLIQRDAQRRMQRVMTVTAVALAGMLVMAGMTTAALSARAEARRQQSQAEGLVEFMLTDLRDRLEGVGRIDVMTDVNSRALAYYRGQDLSRLPPDSLQLRAQALQARGEFYSRRGKDDEALPQFNEARRVTAALLAAEPSNPKRIWAHGQSEYWVGRIAWNNGDHRAATAAFQAYAAQSQRLLAIDPDNAEWQSEAGYAESNLGTVAMRSRSDPRSARGHFERALAHFLAASRLKPSNAGIRRDLADGYGWLADCAVDLGDMAGALENRRQEAQILVRLRAEDPRNVQYARDQLGSNLALAQLELAVGRPERARDLLEQTYATAVQLSAGDPQNATLAQQRAVIGLALVKAIWSDHPSRPANAARVSALLGECRTHAANDLEVRDFCMVLRARHAKRGGPADPQAIAYLAAHQSRLQQTRRSPRWGINFAYEITGL